MLREQPFILKLLEKLDKVDRKSLQKHLADLSLRSEIMLKVMEQIHDGILIVDDDRKILLSNPSSELWLGFRPKPGQILSLDSAIADTRFLRQISANLPMLKDSLTQDIRLTSPKAIDLRVTLKPLAIHPSQKLTLLILTNQNQNASVLSDEQLSRIASLVKFAAGIAHEIGNPLNAIGIHLQLLKKDLERAGSSLKNTAALMKNLEVIESETKRLDRIIKNFLKATRKPPLRFELGDLNQIIETAIEFLKPELDLHRISVEFRQDRALPLFLLDRERLYQSFLNLIKNAREAMPVGGKLLITVRHKDKGVFIRFKDNGVGIPESDLPHIFEAYFTTKEEGSGLGLMTVYNTVREHGGEIDVSSKPGKGSAFTLILPIRQPKLQLPQLKPK